MEELDEENGNTVYGRVKATISLMIETITKKDATFGMIV